MRTVKRDYEQKVGVRNSPELSWRADRNAPGRFRRGLASSWGVLQRAFTLLELSVCLAVIAVLMASTVAAVVRAKERARMVKCQSNLRQLYLVSVMYADSNEGRFPFSSYFVANWPKHLICPSDRNGRPTSYDWNSFFLGSRIEDVKPQFWLGSEKEPWHDRRREPHQGDGKQRGRYNILFGDGTVQRRLMH